VFPIKKLVKKKADVITFLRKEFVIFKRIISEYIAIVGLVEYHLAYG
jgi:hypothetical protein